MGPHFRGVIHQRLRPYSLESTRVTHNLDSDSVPTGITLPWSPLLFIKKPRFPVMSRPPCQIVSTTPLKSRKIPGLRIRAIIENPAKCLDPI